MAKLPDSLVKELASISAKVLAEYTSRPAMFPVPLDGTEVGGRAATYEPDGVSIFNINRPTRYQTKDELMQRRDDFEWLFEQIFTKTDNIVIGISRTQIREALEAFVRQNDRAMDIYVRQGMQTQVTRGYRSWLCFVTARAAYSVRVGQSELIYGLELKNN